MDDPDPHPPNARDQLNSFPFALFLVDHRGVVSEANPAAEHMLSASSVRMVGRPLAELMAFPTARILERLADPEARLVARNVVASIGKRDWEVNVSLTPVAGRPGWHVVTLAEVGQGARFSEEAGQSRLRGQAILAHEIKTPLSAIRGAAQLLARKVPEDAKPLSTLVTDEVDRIVQLIDRMQRLGRESAEPVAPLNLHEAVHRACASLRATQGDGGATLVIEEEFDPSLPQILANEGALVQVLLNLLANARDAASAKDDPRIAIRTRFVSGIMLNVMRLGRPLKLPIEIQVSDNGPGVEPALRDEIFEPFVTSKAKGQGLGLALVQKLVRDMNGRITHSREDGENGGWTHFRIYLPMAGGKA